MNKKRLHTLFFALLILLTVASCNGGGSASPETPSYSVSAVVSGLTGTGLVLQNNGAGDISVASNGTFTFSALVKDGTGYAVTVKHHATAPVQKCSVTNGTGMVSGGNVTGISVVCENAYVLSGSVSTLTGPGVGLVLRNNGTDDLAVVSNGSFTFTTPLLDGESYSVSVLSQPSGPAQACSAFSASGTVSSADVTSISVKCTSNNYAFVTSTSQNGNLGGLAGADALCAERATAGQLPGTFVAWLSTSTVHAKDRLGSAIAWMRPDGKPFADTVLDLTSEGRKIYYPLRLTESGSDVGKNVLTLTGTEFDGTASADTCNNWTYSGTGQSPSSGYADGGTTVWTTVGSASCEEVHPIYCFGTDLSNGFGPTSIAVGRRAFVSEGTFALNAGLAAADALCQAEATAAGTGYSGTYKALLATDGASAASRFTTSSGTEWQRRDGVSVVATAADLVTDLLLAPINRTPGGLYLGNYGVVVGAPDLATAGTAASTCSNWTSTSGSFRTSIAARSAIAGWDESCTSTHFHLYCLQE